MNVTEIPNSKKDVRAEKPTVQRVRINRIRIQNYKGIKDLSLEFPDAPLPDDPDTFMIASANGGGKTALL
ncbi:MAG: hypothetical protein ORO03_02260, partial [Alphaproteobacteria bacterium]|nr:hypothetical protein [Alphaproteobacteria bacterium]